MTRPAGTGHCWCPDCQITTSHDIDFVTDTRGSDFRAACCRICGYLTALDDED